MKLTILQGNTPENVSAELIDLLASLLKGGNLTQDSDLRGSLLASVAYKDSVDMLTDRFENLAITAVSYYIRFEDPVVFETLVNSGFGDGIGISVTDAAAKALGTTFKNNVAIESFNGLNYFTKCNNNDYSFQGCTNLQVINLDGITRFPVSVFQNCNKLVKYNGIDSSDGVLTFSEGTTQIAANAFDNTNIEEIYFPDTLTFIGLRTFQGNPNLTKIHFGLGTVEITQYAFNGCPVVGIDIKNLNTWVQSPNIITSPMDNQEGHTNGVLYENGVPVTSWVCPPTILNINRNTFFADTVLTSVIIPEGVTSIGSYAFAYCTGLTAIQLPKSLISVDGFSNCTNLVIDDIDLPNLSTIGGNAFTYCKVRRVSNLGSITAVRGFAGCSILSSVVLPSTCTQILADAFRNCSSLTQININSNTSKIEGGAFGGCSSLSKFHNNENAGVINLPNLTGALGGGAFENTLVTHVVSLGSIESMGLTVFRGCTNLVEISIPSTVKNIYHNCFSGASALERVNITSLDAWMDIDFTDVGTSNPLENAHHLYLNGTEIENLVIPSTKTQIKTLTFAGGAFQTVTIPNTITNIGTKAFFNCRNLVIPDLNLPNLLTLGNYAFGSATDNGGVKIETITDLGSISKIPDGCFRNCSSLTSVTLPSTLNTIGDYSFGKCTSLSSLTIPSSVTKLGNETFNNCTSLTNVTIPNSVTSMGYSCFFGCTGLTTVITSNTQIGNMAFYSCRNLSSFTCLAVDPPTLGTSVFNNSNLVIYVPAQSVDAYKTATNWSNYASKIQAIPNS